MNKVEIIKSEIAHQQKVLDDTISARGLSSIDVLDLSTILDNYIVLYYRTVYKKK